MITSKCTLCDSKDFREFYSFRNSVFYRCNNCSLIFQSYDSLCSHSEEKERYLEHNNSILSDGYRTFLYNIINPVKQYMNIECKGLDFGSGPYPMMAELLKKESYKVDSFDPYFNDFDLSNKQYDFIILCEVIEHFNRPKKEFDYIRGLLKEDGFLFIQTSLFYDELEFSNWYYKNDMTHVSFFSDKTISYICSEYGLERIKANKKNIVILKSKSI